MSPVSLGPPPFAGGSVAVSGEPVETASVGERPAEDVSNHAVELGAEVAAEGDFQVVADDRAGGLDLTQDVKRGVGADGEVRRERGVRIAGAELLNAAGADVADGERGLLRELAFNGDAELHNVKELHGGVELMGAGGRSETGAAQKVGTGEESTA